MIESYRKVCRQCLDLKNQNASLMDEVRRLLKDNEDYQNLLCNNELLHKNSKSFANSTPIKNFISYKALNLHNNSFSIDEDYEGENMLFDDNFKESFKNIPTQTNNQSANTQNTFDLPALKEVSCIENEELPSCIMKDESTFAKSINFTDCLNEETDNTLCSQVISLEDEKLPQIEMSDSTIVSTTSKSSFSCDMRNIDLNIKKQLQRSDKIPIVYVNRISSFIEKIRPIQVRTFFKYCFSFLLSIHLLNSTALLS